MLGPRICCNIAPDGRELCPQRARSEKRPRVGLLNGGHPRITRAGRSLKLAADMIRTGLRRRPISNFVGFFVEGGDLPSEQGGCRSSTDGFNRQCGAERPAKAPRALLIPPTCWAKRSVLIRRCRGMAALLAYYLAATACPSGIDPRRVNGGVFPRAENGTGGDNSHGSGGMPQASRRRSKLAGRRLARGRVQRARLALPRLAEAEQARRPAGHPIGWPDRHERNCARFPSAWAINPPPAAGGRECRVRERPFFLPRTPATTGSGFARSGSNGPFRGRGRDDEPRCAVRLRPHAAAPRHGRTGPRRHRRWVIVATSTPDLTFPSCATMVQAGLGMGQGEFSPSTVQAVCAGFVLCARQCRCR